MTQPLLEVEDLRVAFAARGRASEVVSGVDLSIYPGEVLGLIGESGSGKTMTGLALLRLLPEQARAAARTLRYRGRDLRDISGRDFDALRGRELAMIFQDPVGAFNPVKTIRWHLSRAVGATRRHDLGSLLVEVGIRDPERVLGCYPHQLSGGMLQRALIAMVFALRPALIIADEPTTNLDNIVEGQILALIGARQRELATALIFVTHDLTVAQTICDRIAVMYAGEIVEIGPTADVIGRPQHPYTIGLLNTARSLERRDEELFEIAGEPGTRADGQACRFSLRCPRAVAACGTSHPELIALSDGVAVRCPLHG
jgi:peptide/nickel transport system ATP-binding protein/oligopeptide transport system ATP-binding protein